MKKKRANFEEIESYSRSAKSFLQYLDRCGVERAALINYVAPEVIGFGPEVNQFVADYVKEDPRRLIACGSVHPRHSQNILADVEHILRLGIRMIKIHPPHQLLYPNDYLRGVKELEIIYRAAEANGIPVMFHTGTSVFPGARNKYGDPIYVDDVAVDFPKMKILLAHGGRPLWMDTAFFLIRRHPNVYLDISGIPPQQAAGIFSAARGDRRQNFVWDGLAGAGRAGHEAECGRFPDAANLRDDARADFWGHGGRDLALVRFEVSSRIVEANEPQGMAWPGSLRYKRGLGEGEDLHISCSFLRR